MRTEVISCRLSSYASCPALLRKKLLYQCRREIMLFPQYHAWKSSVFTKSPFTLALLLLLSYTEDNIFVFVSSHISFSSRHISCDGQNLSIFQNAQSYCLLHRVTKTQDFYLLSMIDSRMRRYDACPTGGHP